MSVVNRYLRPLRYRRDAVHVVGVLVLAVALRVAVYDVIAVRGDLGYWILDGQYIVHGMRPFFDFVGRSPVFLYAYAAVRAVFGGSIAVFRWFVAALWLTAGLGLYGIGRTVTTHRAALVGMALFVCSPFALAFTFYSSSQSLAVALGVAAVATLRVRERWSGYAAAGMFVALAFLSRRSLVLLGPAVAAWAALRWRQSGVSLRATVGRLGAFAAAFMATLWTFYLALAAGDVGAAVDLFLIHFANLFVSAGSGGVPLLSMADAVAHGETATVTDAPPLTPLLDGRSLNAMMATLIGVFAILLPLAEYFRPVNRRWLSRNDRELAVGAGLVLGAYAVYVAATAGYWGRALWAVAAVALVALVWRADGLDPAVLRHPTVTLSVLAWAWVTVGYLVRPNLLATYYAMDALPFLVPLVGIAYTSYWDEACPRGRTLLAVVVATLLVLSALPLSPIQPQALNNESRHDRVSFFSVEKVERLNADLDARDAGVVLTSQPNYVALADAQAFEHNTRALYLRKVFGDHGPMVDYYGRLVDAMQSGRVDHVVWDEANRMLLAANATAQRTFYQCYRPVDADGLYRSLNATLYKYDGC